MNTASNARFALPSAPAPEDFDRLLQLLQTCRQASEPLTIDASRCEAFALEWLQLLLSAQREVGIKIVDLPESCRAHIENLDLLPHFAAALEVSGSTDDVAAARLIDEPARSGPVPKRILTIDDSKTMRDMLMLTLADAGFDVLQAVDGEDGLDVLGRERVDLVITDINMPKMDGYEVIRRVRADPAYRTLPVLVLTTEGEADKRAIAKEAGATGWMVKPFDPERLVQTVLKVAA
jgi:two-component system chemotaxis response regulator CheY